MSPRRVGTAQAAGSRTGACTAGGTSPAHSLVLDLSPPGLRDRKGPWAKPPSYAAPGHSHPCLGGCPEPRAVAGPEQRADPLLSQRAGCGPLQELLCPQQENHLSVIYQTENEKVAKCIRNFN